MVACSEMTGGIGGQWEGQASNALEMGSSE